MQTVNQDKYKYLSINEHLKMRQIIMYSYIFLLFADMFTTYFALTLYPTQLHESVPWTKALIESYGWNGVILRFLLSSILGIFIFKYQPNIVFRYTTPIVVICLLIYAYESTVNNIILMLTV